MSAAPPDRDDGESFLSRWSRRKQQVARGAPRDGADTAPPPTEPKPGVPAEAETKAKTETKAEPAASSPAPAVPEIDLSKLPRLDDLTAHTDYTQFLARGVPEELRTAALRKAWSLDPQIRDFVEVAENQWDWNIPGGVPGSGDLAPGTDLEALLAQATGQSPAPEPPKPVEVADASRADAEPGSLDCASQQDGATPSDADPAPEAEPPARDRPSGQVQAIPAQSATAADDGDAPNEHIARAARRRHGGALPG